MIEEISEENIRKLIEKIPAGISPIEKVILCNDGTVQTLLSVLFEVPIKVNVISQEDDGMQITRWSTLLADDKTVCHAISTINKAMSTEGFLTGIKEKNMGIGQLISSIGINTKRVLVSMASDKSTFSRMYKIIGIGEWTDKIDITIRETFIKSAFYDQP